jgi:hypothetical protein
METMAQDRLARLKEQRSQLDARIRDIEARQRQEERKRDTRRKIIAGALALEHASRDPGFAAVLRNLSARHVTRPSDRALCEPPARDGANDKGKLGEDFSGATKAAEGGLAPGVSEQQGPP